MKKFKFNFYLTSLLTLLIIVLISVYIYELNTAYSIAIIAFMLFLQIVYTFIFIQFRQGIVQDGETYIVPTLLGNFNIQKDDVKSMLVTKGLWGRVLDFSTVTLQLKSGSVVKFVLPSGMVVKMGDYSVLN